MGLPFGTPGYLAPEQIRGGDEITGQTDLYGLGHVLYELLVGEPPFSTTSIERNSMDLIFQHLQKDPPRVREKVPECPAELDALIDRLLAKKPADRPSDAGEVHRTLGEIRDAYSDD